MHLAAKILISVSVSVLAVASAPSAFADPPGVIQVKPPDRHEPPGNVEIHIPRDVTFHLNIRITAPWASITTAPRTTNERA